MSTELKEVIETVIRRIADERGLRLPAISGNTEIVDELGFSSLMVATLIATLEEEIGFDPFMSENVMITDIRTVQDLCSVYAKGLETAADSSC